MTAYLGFLGPMAQAFSAIIALATAFIAAPLIAWATRGKYYLARQTLKGEDTGCQLKTCVICEREYEAPDMAHCPAYQGPICSLCCTLDARCGDLCKPHAKLSSQWETALRWLLPQHAWAHLDKGLGTFLLLMLVIAPLLASLFGLLYQQETRSLAQSLLDARMLQAASEVLRAGFFKAFMALILVSGLVVWWVVLAHQSRRVAQEESNRQTHLLMREIDLHRQTDEALQHARQVAEDARAAAELARLAADQANQAKSRYISAISHELRTPLNSILGYAQLMGEDASIPPHRKQAVSVIKRGGEHLLSLIEGTLDIAHIEAGRLTLNAKPMPFADLIHDLASLFELEAQAKGLGFHCQISGSLPTLVRGDEKRVRQIVINLLGNALKFTQHGQVTLRARYAREMAFIEIEDTGPGLPEAEIDRIFEPFARAQGASSAKPGAGLGLTIAKMLTDLMGGEMSVIGSPGIGSVFKAKLFLPEVRLDASATTPTSQHPTYVRRPRLGYAGPRRRILVVDNEAADRDLLMQVLQPLGFEVRSAASGHDCLDLLASGYLPEVVLMDLAMPGIDGWETLRRLRELLKDSPHAMPQIAIVSANAFDRGLDNDLGVPSEDFILKPVRHADLLDWLERRLGLSWLDTPSPEEALTPAAHPVPVSPPSPQLHALLEMVNLGYYRGILNQLDALEAEQSSQAVFVAHMRGLARQFQFETMSKHISQHLNSPVQGA
ncbi:MAG: periplasmic sensor hybrid histidine kinase [Comamonadaceae bacterium]|nr:MAG: periplasmic sensor hybrid histidine kinase [Comamonadaceae bacterium]